MSHAAQSNALLLLAVGFGVMIGLIVACLLRGSNK